jgi:hypothetical protein
MAIRIRTATSADGRGFLIVNLGLRHAPHNTSDEDIRTAVLAIPEVAAITTFNGPLAADVWGLRLTKGVSNKVINQVLKVAEQVAAKG